MSMQDDNARSSKTLWSLVPLRLRAFQKRNSMSCSKSNFFMLEIQNPAPWLQKFIRSFSHDGFLLPVLILSR
jgi:hypothetical protein